MVNLTLYFSQNSVVSTELLDTFTLLNYPEKLGTSNMFTAYLEAMENGESGKITELKLRKIKQLQRLFEYHLVSPIPDITVRQNCVLAIKYLLGRFFVDDTPVIVESIVLSDITSRVLFNIQTTNTTPDLIKLVRTQANLLQDANAQWYLPILNDVGYPIETRLVFVIYNGVSLPGVQLNTTFIPNRIYGFANNATATIEVLLR